MKESSQSTLIRRLRHVWHPIDITLEIDQLPREIGYTSASPDFLWF